MNIKERLNKIITLDEKNTDIELTKIIDEGLERDYNLTIISLINFLKKLIKSNNNEYLIESIILKLNKILSLISDVNVAKSIHTDIKKLVGDLHRELLKGPNDKISKNIKLLSELSKRLKAKIDVLEGLRKFNNLKRIIFEAKDLNALEVLLRLDNSILKYENECSDDILAYVLKEYSIASTKEDINYLYQVILLIINNAFNTRKKKFLSDEEIVKYNYALGSSKEPHIKEVRELLNSKKNTVMVADLEKRFGITLDYPAISEDVLNEFNINNEGVIDLSNLYTFTIDGEDTRCLDDAFSLVRNKDGSYTLYVHITYIPAIITEDSSIFKRAIEQGETYYLKDRTVSLYPEFISNDLASLLPEKKRYAQTAIWTLEPDLTLVEDSYRLVRSMIKSCRKLTYVDADAIMKKGNDKLLRTSLETLSGFASMRKGTNPKKEAYRSAENALDLYSEHASRLVNSKSAVIVQELMLLYGYAKAITAKREGLPHIYRACTDQRLDKEVLLKNNFSLDDINKLSRMIAYYTETPEPHVPLGFEAYTHGSCPARRAIDAISQFKFDPLIRSKFPESDRVIYELEREAKVIAVRSNEIATNTARFVSAYNGLTNFKEEGTKHKIRSRKVS